MIVLDKDTNILVVERVKVHHILNNYRYNNKIQHLIAYMPYR